LTWQHCEPVFAKREIKHIQKKKKKKINMKKINNARQTREYRGNRAMDMNSPDWQQNWLKRRSIVKKLASLLANGRHSHHHHQSSNFASIAQLALNSVSRQDTSVQHQCFWLVKKRYLCRWLARFDEESEYEHIRQSSDRGATTSSNNNDNDNNKNDDDVLRLVTPPLGALMTPRLGENERRSHVKMAESRNPSGDAVGLFASPSDLCSAESLDVEDEQSILFNGYRCFELYAYMAHVLDEGDTLAPPSGALGHANMLLARMQRRNDESPASDANADDGSASASTTTTAAGAGATADAGDHSLDADDPASRFELDVIVGRRRAVGVRVGRHLSARQTLALITAKLGADDNEADKLPFFDDYRPSLWLVATPGDGNDDGVVALHVLKNSDVVLAKLGEVLANFGENPQFAFYMFHSRGSINPHMQHRTLCHWLTWIVRRNAASNRGNLVDRTSAIGQELRAKRRHRHRRRQLHDAAAVAVPTSVTSSAARISGGGDRVTIDDVEIVDLRKQLASGLVLICVVEEVLGVRIQPRRYFAKPRTRRQREHNISVALLECQNAGAMERAHVTSAMIIDGALAPIMALIWEIAFRHHAKRSAGRDIEVFDALVRWCSRATKHATGIRDFGASFRDGTALCALLYAYKPALMPLSVWRADEPSSNVQLVAERIAQHLRLPQLVDADEWRAVASAQHAGSSSSSSSPYWHDELSLILYLLAVRTLFDAKFERERSIQKAKGRSFLKLNLDGFGDSVRFKTVPLESPVRVSTIRQYVLDKLRGVNRQTVSITDQSFAIFVIRDNKHILLEDDAALHLDDHPMILVRKYDCQERRQRVLDFSKQLLVSKQHEQHH
jgi:Calponin homology (CH) domain